MTAPELVSAGAVTPAIRVLVADDEPHLPLLLQQFLAARGYAVTVVRDGCAALQALADDPYDVALLDVVMPEVDGLEVLRRVREAPAPPEVLVVTGNGTVETALAAHRLGAYQLLAKPYRMAEVEAVVRRAWEKRVLRRDRQRWLAWRRRLDPATPFLTAYAPLRAVLALVREGAPGMAPMLVTGEVGTGKRCLARQWHQWSDAPTGPLVEWVIAATRPEHQALELFGEVQGDSPPLLELAAGGTLVLHGVEALEPAVGARLAEALARGVWSPGRSRRVRMLDVRLVGTSRVAQATEVAGGLRAALGGLRVTLPPLAERRVDLPLLAQHFLEQAVPGVPPQLAPATLEAMERYAWPGNVRELRAVMERAALLAADGTVGPALVPGGGEAMEGAAVATRQAGAPSGGVVAMAPLEVLERGHIEAVLEATGWHQGRAAARLGISPKTLYRKIRGYGLVRPTPRGRGAGAPAGGASGRDGGAS
ncbi:MAG: sigma-54 dependent transcriptional regulator [Gemmatimonadetes bacterium]|nr:sigma-54 dependent transcriptional regulator [Gemmatimonadota bacterium]